MNKKRYYLSASFILIVGVFVGLAISSRLEITSPLIAKGQVSSRSVETLSQLSDALSEVAGVATPSVVNISSTRVIKQNDQAPFDFFDDPFFRRFFGDQVPRPNVPK